MFNILIGLAILTPINCYVLLQVRKGENQSNIDALIHKVVPAKKFDKIAKTARKHFHNSNKYKLENKHNHKELESLVFAIKTDNRNGEKPKGSARNQKITNLLTDIKQIIVDFAQPKEKSQMAGPNFRAKLEKYNIRPELIQFGNGRDKPSVLYEVETKSILHGMVDALNSKKFQRYSDNFIRAIAYAVHAITDD